MQVPLGNTVNLIVGSVVTDLVETLALHDEELNDAQTSISATQSSLSFEITRAMTAESSTLVLVSQQVCNVSHSFYNISTLNLSQNAR